MPATYEKIATTTLGSATFGFTFSSIPSTYTDLRLVITGSTTNNDYGYISLNSDTGNNYSYTVLTGNGSAAASTRGTNAGFLTLNINQNLLANNPFMMTFDFMSYSGSTFKTVLETLSNDKNGSGAVERSVQLWRSTSAINSIYMYVGTGNLNIGTTATLYGILKA
jgi:hypothetical protein